MEDSILIINSKNIARGKYKVYTNDKKLKYFVKGRIISHKPYLNICNKFGKKVAMIQQSKRSFRLYEKHDFVFKINNKEVARFKKKFNLLKESYIIDNGWNINFKMIKGIYEIKDDNKTVAVISNDDKNNLKISICEEENELIVLMIVLAIFMYTVIDERKMQKLSKESGGS